MDRIISRLPEGATRDVARAEANLMMQSVLTSRYERDIQLLQTVLSTEEAQAHPAFQQARTIAVEELEGQLLIEERQCHRDGVACDFSRIRAMIEQFKAGTFEVSPESIDELDA